MSDEVFVVATPYTDVAELGQGYVDRADGERILLPLPAPHGLGDGVRFIVQLADGTPAFAGAGRCAQVSDQGDTVPEAERYETLLDSLVFDERSRPVYGYIVAVREAVYAAGGAEAEVLSQDAAESIEAEAEGAEAVVEASEDEPTAFIESVSMAEAAVVREPEAFDAAPEPEAAAPYEEAERDAFARPAAPAYPPEPPPEPVVAPAALSVVPLPQGTLQRPSVAAHWQPAPPEPPRPTRGSGLFRYPPGPLPSPALPPHPALPPSRRVSRAPSPAR